METNMTQHAAPTRQRHIYALTSNGDWTELTPGCCSWGEPEIAIFAVEVDTLDDFCAAAENGDGDLLGTLVIKDDRPVIT
jgi:hypothetical protein